MKEEPKHLTAEQAIAFLNRKRKETEDPIGHDEVSKWMEEYAEKRVREAKIEMLQGLIEFNSKTSIAWKNNSLYAKSHGIDFCINWLKVELSKLKGE